ncbi:DAK2 domain-containing protein [Salinicoccus hispanicus]|uniref:DAK2 domain-containing protein n=1 Tax=Salinicoccus hispanicus TaxID=157225 RepID=A0A6N8TYS2_9STAP|nr:DAK2 domain-containing protein [Salinicoccus hispanicus]MXQ49846.1 DAK2 domain-containing protein [Salinicoccus hispanicus]
MDKIDGRMFRNMILSGAENLRRHADYVDSLNVFPVPDGDTGTNMNLSMTSGADEVEDKEDAHIGTVGKHFSKGLLMGARGNSGVILSQLFRGFSKAIEEKQEIEAADFTAAFGAGVKTAYKAVMKPVEGTILTVAKDSAKKVEEISASESSIITIMEAVIKEAKSSLERTPELLPVLKEVGVVDSGGQGLVYVYEGFLSALKGEPIEVSGKSDTETFVNDEHDFEEFMSVEDIEYGFCTEFMVRFESDKREFDEDGFRQDMSEFGDSLLVISDEEIVKVHVHTETPGEAMTYGATYGELIKMKIENMREQFRAVHHKQDAAPERKEGYDTAIITVSSGEGVNELFRSIGATHVINGGQTMNPSTEDILRTIEDEAVKSAIILPNNKNIIMAAEQARDMLDIPAVVIPTRSIPEGLSSLLVYSPDAELEENKDAMEASLEHVKTGQVTYAVRDTKIDGIEIRKDQHMGIKDGKITGAHDSREASLKQLIESMLDEESEIVTVLIGDEGDQEEVDRIIEALESEYDEVEFEVHDGQQPVYSYLLSVE